MAFRATMCMEIARHVITHLFPVGTHLIYTIKQVQDSSNKNLIAGTIAHLHNTHHTMQTEEQKIREQSRGPGEAGRRRSRQTRRKRKKERTKIKKRTNKKREMRELHK